MNGYGHEAARVQEMSPKSLADGLNDPSLTSSSEKGGGESKVNVPSDGASFRAASRGWATACGDGSSCSRCSTTSCCCHCHPACCRFRIIRILGSFGLQESFFLSTTRGLCRHHLDAHCALSTVLQAASSDTVIVAPFRISVSVEKVDQTRTRERSKGKHTFLMTTDCTDGRQQLTSTGHQENKTRMLRLEAVSCSFNWPTAWNLGLCSLTSVTQLLT